MKFKYYLLYGFLILCTTFCWAQTDKEIQTWIQQTKDLDVLVRVNAVGELASVTTAQSVQALIQVMKDDTEFYLREKAAKSLMAIGIPAVEQTLPLLKGKNEELCSLAVWVLQSASGQNYGKDSQKWENWWKEYKKKSAQKEKKK